MVRRHAFARSGFGMRGGIGPTAGKKQSKFRVTFPDGTCAIIRRFHWDLVVDAQAVVYRHKGEWCVYQPFVRGTELPGLARREADGSITVSGYPDRVAAQIVDIERIG